MKITGTNSYINVEYNGLKIRIEGEMTVGGFIASKDSMVLINSDSILSVFEKIELINDIENYTKNSHMKIVFE